MTLWKKYSMLAGGALILAACSSSDHAGVIRTTESGKTLAGTVVTHAGDAVAHTSVYVVASDYTAHADSILYSTVSDDNGNYQILLCNLADGEYTVLFENAESNLVSKEELEIESDTKTVENNTLTLNTELSTASEIAIDIEAYKISAGNTLCLNGTLSCTVITDTDISNGIAVLTAIPEADYSYFTVYSSQKISTHYVDMEIDEGEAYTVSGKATKAQLILSRTLPDSLQSKIQTDVDSATFPIWISNKVASPLLMDDNGFVLPTEKVYSTADSTLYWSVFPTVDLSASTSQKLYIFNSEIQPVFSSQVRYSMHWDSLSAEGVWAGAKAYAAGDKPDTVKAFPVIVDGNFAVSFWTKIEKSAFENDSSIALFTALEDSLGIVIRQNGSSKNLGVELFVDSDTLVISDTTVYGSSKIADGNWHHYAVSINGHHITILKDGKVIRNTDFELSKGFGNVQSFTLGDSRLEGILDEFKILGGTQDSNSLRLIYELERADQIPWTEVDD